MQNKFKIDEVMLVLIVAFIAVISVAHSKVKSSNQTEAQKITELILDDHEVSFVSNGIVDEDKLRQVQDMEYRDLKKHFKVKNDFCLYIEDGNGKVMLAKGSGIIEKEGVNCAG